MPFSVVNGPSGYLIGKVFRGLSGCMKRKAALILLSLVWAVSLATKSLRAQFNFKERSCQAVQTTESITIDGKLDDPAWAAASIATDFTDYKTDNLALEQTLVRVIYDNQYIYVGFECLEPDPNAIQATERKYDRPLRGDDWVSVQFDTYHDHRSYYSYTTNPLATRYDQRSGIFRGGGRRSGGSDASWNNEWWEVACTIAEDRWFAEMKIPIGNMNFIREDNVVWGVNFQRGEKGRQEDGQWCYYPSRMSSARHFGVMTGLNLSQITVPLRPKVEYYISNTNSFRQGAQDFSTGADVTMRLNSQVVSTFTINPDFGQVEADPDTIELRDTERFLEERRPFFREGAEIFNTPVNIYYSRRFVDIEGGAKMTGNGKNWAFGALDLQGEIDRDGTYRKGNYGVGRFIYNLGENSNIGMVATSSEQEDGYNRVGGFDTQLYLNEDTSITAQFLSMCDSEGIETDDHIDRSAYALESAIRGGTKPWFFSLTYRDITRGFKPDLGFISRRNIRGPSTWINYREDYAEGPIKNFSLRSNITYYENNEKTTTIRDFDENIEVTLRNELQFQYSRQDQFHFPYQNRADRFEISYNEVDRWNSIKGGYTKGVFSAERYDEFSLEKPIKITDRLTTTIRGNYRVSQPETGNHEQWLWRWATEYSWAEKGRIKLTAEDTSEKRNNLTLLITWPIREDLDFYILYNDYLADGIEEQGAFAKLVYRF